MASSVIKKEFVIDAVSVSGVAVSGNASATATMDASKSGYTPVGIIQVSKSGAGSGFTVITSFDISGNNARVAVYNMSSTDRTITVSAKVLYQRS